METGMQFNMCPQHYNDEKYEPVFENETGDLECEVIRSNKYLLKTLFKYIFLGKLR